MCVSDPNGRSRVRTSSSFVPIFSITSGCALTHTPSPATSRSSASSTTRVALAHDRIDPHQHPVEPEQLRPHLVDELVVEHHRLRPHAGRLKRIEHRPQPLPERHRRRIRAATASPRSPRQRMPTLRALD